MLNKKEYIYIHIKPSGIELAFFAREYNIIKYNIYKIFFVFFSIPICIYYILFSYYDDTRTMILYDVMLCMLPFLAMY